MERSSKPAGGAQCPVLFGFLLAAGAVLGMAGSIPRSALAQPAASFQAKCADVRREMGRLDFKGDPLIVIQVAGKLREVRTGDPVILSICDAPAPRIVCITYSSERLELDAEIIVSGSIARRSDRTIILDPCLHYPPE